MKELLSNRSISPLYQSILRFERRVVLPGAQGESLIEHFLPWIQKIILAYQEQKESENYFLKPKNKFSNAYYTKKLN